MLGRRLEHVSSHQHVGKPQLTMRVMSFNVLADHLLYLNSYLYENCRPEVLPFDYRKNLILHTIISQDPTIVCLQEIDNKYFESFYLTELRKYGYEGEYIKRTGTDKFDGVATFYKKNEFKLLHCDKIKYYVDRTQVLDRDNVGLLLTLEPQSYRWRKLPRRLCVANTHLLYNTKRGDVKLAQLAYLLAYLDKAAQIPGEPAGSYYPSFLCGDMNSKPFSPLYNFITSGKICYNQFDKWEISGQSSAPEERRLIRGPILPDHLTYHCTFADQSEMNSCCINKSTADSHLTANSASSQAISIDQSESSTGDLLAFPPATMTNSSVHSSLSTQFHDSSVTPEMDTKRRRSEDVVNGDVSTSQPGSALSSSKDNQMSKHQKKRLARREWGTLTHRFNFISTHRHDRIERLLPYRRAEVTTQHSQTEGLTVDYIFYTGANNQPNNSSNSAASGRRNRLADNGNITLLSRCGLLSSQELRLAGNLPNHTAPSDHLPLIAEYSLHK